MTQALPITRDGASVDLEAACRAAADFLSALGVAIDQEDLRDTPARMARAYAELFDARPLRLTTFANDEGYDELVLARAIPFRTVCEHHLLPFSGVAHVGYLPGERIVGLSKLARPQRPLWASTSVKDPAYPDTRYVTGLVAPDVVNTMPEATLRAVADHGEIPDDPVRGHYAEAREVLSELEAIGVDYGDVTEGLESNGLAAFDASWRELGDQIATQLRRPSEDSQKESKP